MHILKINQILLEMFFNIKKNKDIPDNLIILFILYIILIYL